MKVGKSVCIAIVKYIGYWPFLNDRHRTGGYDLHQGKGVRAMKSKHGMDWEGFHALRERDRPCSSAGGGAKAKAKRLEETVEREKVSECQAVEWEYEGMGSLICSLISPRECKMKGDVRYRRKDS